MFTFFTREWSQSSFGISMVDILLSHTDTYVVIYADHRMCVCVYVCLLTFLRV